MKKPARTVPPAPAPVEPAGAAQAPQDIALLAGPTEDGEGARVLRFTRGELHAGEVRPVREGQPIGQQELIRLRPLHDRVPLCAVEVVHAPEAARHDGPSRVATDRYRRNWDHVFGGGAQAGAPVKKKLRELN